MLSCSLKIPLNQDDKESLLSAVFEWDGDGILGLQGPSGSGKTTLLKQLAGFKKVLKTPQHSIIWKKKTWESAQKQLKAYRRPVTLVFQEHPLFPHLDVAQNLEFARQHSYRSISDNEFNAILSDFDLLNLINKKSIHLSGGQQSRIALVQGLLARPELLLLDEPFSALDAKTRHGTTHALKHHTKQLGISTILVSHVPQELASICDALITIKQNQLSGPHKDLLKILNQETNNDESIPATTYMEASLKSFDAIHHLSCFEVSGRDILVACTSQPNTNKVIEIPASEVSLVLEQPSATSIANCIEVILESWIDVNDGLLLQLKFNQQRLSCKITQYSFEKLDLKHGQKLFAQFKATAIKIL